MLDGWRAARVSPGGAPGDGDWVPAVVPGTVADAFADAEDLDEHEWWFRATFDADGAAPLRLVLDGVATLADVFVDDDVVAASVSMFLAQRVELGVLAAGAHVLDIRCRALAPELARQRKPRVRWRTKLVTDSALRWWRTSLLGRSPGVSPGPPIVGPWRPVRVERADAARVDDLEVRAVLAGDAGVVTVRGSLAGAAEATVRLRGRGVDLSAPLEAGGAELPVADPARWWPHTHGEPALYDVEIAAGDAVLARRRVGFRSLAPGPAPGHDVLAEGLDLHVN
ncbi:MAG: beta-mannosidase, partial [Solirubrobacteraceae bacterium]|nr:beta-mannosidase [Solirubrobacteraceae bacterium]